MPNTLTIHTVGGVPGHFFVELNDGTKSIYGGFAPADGYHYLSAVTPVPGQVKQDDDRLLTDPTHLSSSPIPITDQGAQNVRDYIDKVHTSPGGYDPYNRDCIDFANGALQAAGTGKDVGAVLSPEQKDQMNAAEIWRNHKYPDNTGLTYPMPPSPGNGTGTSPNPFLDSPLAKQFPTPPPPPSLTLPIPPASGGGQSTTGTNAVPDASGLTSPPATSSPSPNVPSPASPDGKQSDADSSAGPGTGSSTLAANQNDTGQDADDGDDGDGSDNTAAPASSQDDDDDGPLTDGEAAELTRNFAPDSMVLNDLDT